MNNYPIPNRVLNILSLEDTLLDYEIINFQLSQAGFKFTISRVDAEIEFSDSISKNRYDIILADFNLPGFDAFKALQLCNEICPDTPYICVSGSIGEEMAIELLKLGAVDYVLKDRPERLPLAICRALYEAERKENLRKVENQLQKLSRAVEQSPASVLITNIDGVIEYVNEKFSEVTGYSKEEAIGKNPSILQSGLHNITFYEGLWNNILSGKEWNGELLNKKKNGELYWEAVRISPLIDDHGKVINLLAVKEDITEKKKMIEELILAKERAEESDRLKSAFLANISHEIRTPMNGILGFTELLKEPNLDGNDQKFYIELIDQSGNRMLNLMNNIIDISRIDAGEVSCYMNLYDIRKKFEYHFDFFNNSAKQKGVKLTYNIKLESNECVFKTDEQKLDAVLTNLVKNAIKFTNNGSVEFGCEKFENCYKFFVKDSGIGIEPEHQKIIFDRFRQASESLSRPYEGAGLGLSISKAYVEILGGKIWVESNIGIGSTFYFTLSANLENEKQNNNQKVDLDRKNLQVTEKVNILIVDDDDVSMNYMELIVEEFSDELFFANNGLEAVEIFRKNQEIRIILMDMKMPVMDGYQATMQIRKMSQDVIIIAQTAYNMEGDREKAISAGCNDHIAKPVSKKKLLLLMRKYLENN